MSRAEFMEKLEYLLQDLSQEDREDGIAFYRDYLDEAGPEREQEVLREFGSPERIDSIIRSNLQVDLEDGGIFSENGFEDERFREPGYQVVKRKDLPDVLEENRQRNDDGHAQTEGRERTEYEWTVTKKRRNTPENSSSAASGLSFVSGYPRHGKRSHCRNLHAACSYRHSSAWNRLPDHSGLLWHCDSDGNGCSYPGLRLMGRHYRCWICGIHVWLCADRNCVIDSYIRKICAMVHSDDCKHSEGTASGRKESL